ncbi:MAG: hypothetical protein FWG91_03085 [Lachnospiraceae bacterium]|nr:hypothetical protein [Lachnospiraceae bacterium]
MKRKIALALCFALIIATMFPTAAYARGGHGKAHHGGKRISVSASPRFALCPADNCEVYGPHEHDGDWYCNQSGINWSKYAVCEAEDCTILGLHEHDGAWYHCADYPYGGGSFCGGRNRNW